MFGTGCHEVLAQNALAFDNKPGFVVVMDRSPIGKLIPWGIIDIYTAMQRFGGQYNNEEN